MGTVEFFRTSMNTLHGNLLDAVKDLNQEQLHFRPLGKGNHIAFTLWHVVRTEDIVVHFFLQKKNPVWNAEGWDKKFDVDPRSQGTGMSAEEAAAVKIQKLSDFLKYAENVFKASEAYLETIKEADLEQSEEYPVLGKRTFREVLGGTILQHGSSHLGEIWYAKGLQGLKGSPI